VLSGRFDTERERAGERLDEWGCIWEKAIETNMGQVKGHPIKNINDIQQYSFPLIWDKVFANLSGEIEKAGKEKKYIRFEYFILLFERMHSLLGIQSPMEGLYLFPELIEKLADGLCDYVVVYIQQAVAAADGAIYGFGFAEDWGTQENTFISLEKWREIFKPRYMRIFEVCRQNGLVIRMHSCGKINDFIGDFIEIGLNTINLQQPRALGIDEIGRLFQGKICFEVTCDIQKTLPFGTNQKVEEEAVDLLEKLGTSEGGFILSEYGEDSAIGVSHGRGQHMLNCFLKHQKQNPKYKNLR
jgi:uroporphyrinogen decarboxylase